MCYGVGWLQLCTHALRCEYRLKSHFNDNRQPLYYANNTKMVVGEQTPICYRTARKPRGDSGLDYAHEHICFAVRFANVDLSLLCPQSKQKAFSPGRHEACENCRYFGTVSYVRSAVTEEPQLHFEMEPDIVQLIRWKELGK